MQPELVAILVESALAYVFFIFFSVIGGFFLERFSL